MKRALLLGFLLVLSCASFALAAPVFPKFTGYVVDEAHVLSPGVRARLSDKLADFEAKTKGQVVVVTLRSLNGMEIQDYGYQLGRAWGVGQKGKNNGAILLVAPNDHKVGIEVGYGYEGTLTDAATGVIINNTILPSMRDGNVEQGIWKGTEAILSILNGNSIAQATADAPLSPAAAPVPVAVQQDGGGELSNTAIFFILIIVVIFCIRYPMLAWFIFSNVSAGSYRGGGSRSGGFSGGGGGSFGGGGSSGSW